ncbi:hypothetical protein GCM10010156_26880 [Planobispora rosea]|uniref:Uncharacterized protein n=1 Tax=Planobispora rosea TaxID=35762 RepID=A0A8J3S1B3_PLARO|nr:hypothetical protein GCM10010156_26880 [Planobispora rosea]GIH85050.1 hypothetical protein Pro02_34580 [Planobispora rosea]
MHTDTPARRTACERRGAVGVVSAGGITYRCKMYAEPNDPALAVASASVDGERTVLEVFLEST